MLRRLLASFLVVGSAVALFAPAAKAQSVNIPFSGRVATNCTFGAPSIGLLTLVGTNTLAGSGGSVSISCSAPANITTSAPIQTISTTTLSPVSCSVGLGLGGSGNLFESCVGTSPPLSLTAGSRTTDVIMSVTDDVAIPPGDYSYIVTLTITP
jgi:hypothetical protein